ncbi:F-box protein At3g07870-like isoform X2 [Cornus florida]|uniref:F-box protein At3g07870-like isoform X2 n=1 Tax=Cornus florida TaxID=4283 RepID=UPI002899B267|nr:F-box protein At3g07870-like isoform X2 [Cornus florida]XP_059649212.1 F-box protein At3g07870-like isoform X2 [Cornus florida]
MRKVSMGILKGCLWICEASNYINIWVMKKYGVQESWTKLFAIDTINDPRWSVGLYQPIKYLEDGAILMFHYFTSTLICYDPDGPKLKYLKIHGTKMKFEAIVHSPSFISLKEAVVGDNAMVLNIYSRCAGFKVLGDTKDLSLAEQIRDMEYFDDFDPGYSDDSEMTDGRITYSSSETDKWRKHRCLKW